MNSSVPYIDYHKLKESYTIPELCDLFQMEKGDLRNKCEQYEIKPRRDEIGEYVIVKYDVRKLHNAIYHEANKRNSSKDDDPWA